MSGVADVYFPCSTEAAGSVSNRIVGGICCLALALLLPCAHAQDSAGVAACQVKAEQEKSPQSYEVAKSVYEVRKLIYDQKSDEALTAAKALLQTNPSDSNVQATLGEAYYRHGDLPSAASAINQAVQLDPCNARAHFDEWQFFTLTGMRRTALQQLTLAHQLNSKDNVIDFYWQLLQKQPEVSEASRCRLVSSGTSATIPIDPRGNTPAFNYGAVLNAKVNGKSFHLLVDTGDPGITLTADEAKQAGIMPEHTYNSGSHGATGDGSISGYTGHLKTLQLGPITIADCPVNVVTSPFGGSAIGLKVFEDFLVTLDVQHARIQLSPLPPLPDTDKGGGTHDRFIAPSMSSWLHFYEPFALERIVVPVQLGTVGTYLFILDTGAPVAHIDQDAAAEVTTVTRDNVTQVIGYGGAESNVYQAERVPLRVGAISRTYAPMLAYTRAGKSEAAGLRISGNLGFDLARDTTISIDYRDLLINFQPNGRVPYP